jgi:serine/threonine protein kinase
MTILKGIVSGCKTFHERGVVHRDLKPSNILMKAGVPKVSDFGYCEITGGKKPRVYYNVGSPSYMPPEAYIKNYYSEKSDVWGVGMIYYEMLKGSTLDKGKEVSETYNFIRTGGRFVPPGVSPQSERILLECIKFDFNKRISFKDLDRLVNGQSLVQTNDTVVNGPERNNQLINGLNGQNVNATNKQ